MYINLDVLNISNGNINMVDTEFGRMTIEKIDAGKLKLKTGKIIATDPILMYDDESFNLHVTSGIYPVYIYVGKVEKRKNQTVAAEIRFNENPAVKWEMALFKGESSSGFAHDEFMGYEVENGVGCFMDECVMEILDRMSEDELEKYEKEIRNKLRNSKNSCAEILVDQKTGCNVVIFPSGWNNGVFPTYYGFDNNNKLTKIVTDFMVIEK